jgi:hypothetical protein
LRKGSNSYRRPGCDRSDYNIPICSVLRRHREKAKVQPRQNLFRKETKNMKDSKIQESTGKRLPPNAGKGRKKGIPNRLTRTIREALEAAFSEVGAE